MTTKAKRRFIALEPKEVSLVDAGAVEEPFHVLKNQGDKDMATAADTTSVPVQVADDSSEHVAKALEHVKGIVAEISSIAKAAKPAADDKPADDDKSDKGEEVATVKSILEASGLEGDKLTDAVSKLTAQGVDVNKGLADAKPASTDEEPKTGDATDDAPAPVAAVTMADIGEAITKAASFTPDRIKKLKDMQETLKLMIDAIAPGTSPATSTPKVDTHPNPDTTTPALAGSKGPGQVDVSKAAEAQQAQLLETLKSLGDGIKTLSDRMETIEGTRQGTNSGGDDEGTDTDVKKSENIWTGLL